MSEKKLTTLETRKRLLIAESEINRALLVQDYEVFAGELREVTEPIKRAGSLVSAGISMFKAFRAGRAESAKQNGSWFPFGLIRLLLDMWGGPSRSAKSEQEEESVR